MTVRTRPRCSPECLESLDVWDSNGVFNSIQGIAFDQHGQLHVLDSFLNAVQILDPETGAYISHYNAFVQTVGPHLQLDIDISPDGKVIMTNKGTRKAELIYTVGP